MIRYNTTQGLDQHDDLLANQGFEFIQHEYECGDIGYYHLPNNSHYLIDEAQKLSKEVDFDTVVVIGIGGSSLGIKAIERMLSPVAKDTKRLVYLENSDPITIKSYTDSINPDKSLFLVISKSGGTVETLSIFKYVIDKFSLKLDNSERIIAISDDGSALARFSDAHKIRRFVIPDNVGGRFSVLSAVGVVPLTLAGYDVKSILDGAKEFLDRFLARKEDHLLHKAVYYAANRSRYPINVVFGYSDVFDEFGKWIVQIWGESLGKFDYEGNRVGLTPIALIGSVDQHSFLQLIIEGTLNKTVTFIDIEHSDESVVIPNITLDNLENSDFVNGKTFNELISAQCQATMQSVMQTGVPTDEIAIDRLDGKNIGELIIYYEILTSTCGALMQINTYDQPGVEIGKKLLHNYFTNL